MRLCVWHLDRAVKEKLKQPKRSVSSYDGDAANTQFSFVDPLWVPRRHATGVICSAEQRDEIANLMKKHYDWHPMIPWHGTCFEYYYFLYKKKTGCINRSVDSNLGMSSYRTATELHQKAAKEMYYYCTDHNLPEAWAYLFKRWYTSTWWRRWARAGIPIAKTTMMIEAHWRALKRKHLLHHNRPRLELLVWIIINRVTPPLLDKFSQCITASPRRDAFRWEKEFARRWRKSKERTVRPGKVQEYGTDAGRWTCACPAFAKSRFMLCKHLVSISGRTGIFAALEVYIKRSSSPPFVQIFDNVSTHV